MQAMLGKSGTPKSSVTIGDAGTVLTPRSRAARRTTSIQDIVLDPAQRAAVEQPAGNALLILGEAGHGKTTVAIHRLAHLWKSSSTPLRAAVIVPTEGLAASLQPMLRQLGVDLEVMTYDRWASLQARRAFRRLPRESESTPPSVMRLKRHPELRSALAELANREPGRIDNDMEVAAPPANVLATRGDLQHGPCLRHLHHLAERRAGFVVTGLRHHARHVDAGEHDPGKPRCAHMPTGVGRYHPREVLARSTDSGPPPHRDEGRQRARLIS
jgi:hypothetical protein